MSKLFESKNLNDEAVKQLLSSESSGRTAAEAEKIEQYLAKSDECAQFAHTIERLKETEAIAYLPQPLSLTEKGQVVRQIDAKLAEKSRMVQSHTLNRFASSAVVLMVALIVGVFAFSMRGSGSTTVDTLASPERGMVQGEEAALDYDGWELGVAFNIPDEWSQSQLVVDKLDGCGTVLSMGDEIYDLTEASQPALKAEETFGYVLVDYADFRLIGSPTEQLEQFHRSGFGFGGVWTDIAGRQVIVTESTWQVDSGSALLHFVAGSLLVDGRFVRVTIFGRFADEADKVKLTDQLNEIVASMQPADYVGWNMWTHPEQGFMLTYPDQLAVGESQAGSMTLEPIRPDAPFRLTLEYDRPTATSRTLAERQVVLLADFAGGAVVDAPWSPAHRPDLLFGRYELPGNDTIALLTGVLAHPDPNSEQPFIATTFLIDKSQVELYQPRFEQIMRSIRWEDVPLLPPYLRNDGEVQKTRRVIVAELSHATSILKSGLTLHWAEWDRPTVQPGDSLEMGFQWQAVAAMQQDYNLFVHLLNGDGELVAQLDGELTADSGLTSDWPLWGLVIGQYELLIPDDLPAGEYTLVMGHYDVESGRRLELDGSDQIELGTIAVAEAEPTADEMVEAVSESAVARAFGIEADFQPVIFSQNETFVMLKLTGSLPEVTDLTPDSEVTYQFGFPTTLSTQNGGSVAASATSIEDDETGGRLHRLEFPSIPLANRSDTVTLNVAQLTLRDLPADRLISLDLAGRQPGEQWDVDETFQLNGIAVTLETAQLDASGTSLMLGLAPAHALETHVVESFTATVFDAGEPLADGYGAIGGDLWSGGPGKMTLEVAFEQQPAGVVDLYFEGNIRYTVAYEFQIDVATGAEIND